MKKKCIECGAVFDARDGRNKYCAECKTNYFARYRRKNRERINEYNRKWMNERRNRDIYGNTARGCYPGVG